MIEQTERTGEISDEFRSVLDGLKTQAFEKYELEVSDEVLIDSLIAALN